MISWRELTLKEREVYITAILPHDLKVISSHLGHQGNTLVFGPKLYGRSQIYLRIFAYVPECHPDIPDVMTSLLGNMGSNEDMSLFVGQASLLLPVSHPHPLPGSRSFPKLFL